MAKKKDLAGNNDFVIIQETNSNLIDRYGAANSEYFKAYTGVDQNTGQTTRLGLKEIEKWNNIDGKSTHQQAGYAAEVAKAARDNAQNIINGESKRTIRTDDLDEYGINHPIYDHVEIDGGKVINHSGSQMKFVNNIKEKLINNIAKGEGGGKNDWSRYLDVKLDVPSDQLDSAEYQKQCGDKINNLLKKCSQMSESDQKALKERLDKLAHSDEAALKKICRLEAEELKVQAKKLEIEGQCELAQKKMRQANNCEKVADNLRDSGLTTEDAKFYREHPALATLKDIATTSHEAGMYGGLNGALVGGGISTLKNIYSFSKDEIEIDEVLANITKETALAASKGYLMTAGGAMLKSSMEQMPSDMLKDMYMASRRYLTFSPVSASELTAVDQVSTNLAAKIRHLSKTSLPGIIVATSIEIAPLLESLCRGEISKAQFTNILSQKGVAVVSGIWGGTYGALVGNLILPGMGALIGGMAGSFISATISTMLYESALGDIYAAKIAKRDMEIARSNYFRVRELYKRSLAQLEESFEQFFQYLNLECKIALDKMQCATTANDIREFESGARHLASVLNCKLSHSSFMDFKSAMLRRKHNGDA